MTATADPHCPLCLASAVSPYHRDHTRDYLSCSRCQLVFVPAAQHLSEDAEKAAYDLHENDPRDPGYRRFLERLVVPLAERLPRPGSGLDFGSGPGPALVQMFAERGHSMALYDKFYQPDTAVLATGYDFITATEVVEHLRDPRAELTRLWSRIRPGGLLGIMTKLVRDRDAFTRWHYIRDPTHVCFFARSTFEYLARAWQAELTFVANDALIISKRAR